MNLPLSERLEVIASSEGLTIDGLMVNRGFVKFGGMYTLPDTELTPDKVEKRTEDMSHLADNYRGRFNKFRKQYQDDDSGELQYFKV